MTIRLQCWDVQGYAKSNKNYERRNVEKRVRLKVWLSQPRTPKGPNNYCGLRISE